MKTIFHLNQHFGSFLANGSNGDEFRRQHIEPLWNKATEVVIDFSEIESMTDSFANAFIGNIVNAHPQDFREKLRFTNCNSLVKSFIKAALQRSNMSSLKA